MNEKEVGNLLRADNDCIKYPKDEAVLVRRRGKKEMQMLRGNFLLDATGRNLEPENARDFDASLVNQSPKKILNKWTNQFGSVLRPKSDLDFSKQNVSASISPIRR